MNEKERVLGMLQQLPEDVSLTEIVRRFEELTGIKMADVRMHPADAIFVDEEPEPVKE